MLPISHKEIVKFRFHKFTFWLVNYLINQAGGGVLNCPGLSSIPHFFLWLLHNDFSSFFFKFCFVSVFYYVKNVFQFLMFINTPLNSSSAAFSLWISMSMLYHLESCLTMSFKGLFLKSKESFFPRYLVINIYM